ncbi:family 1 glycosylhydrolase [Paracoccus sp. S-4012]|nr:family 1 glycosylhydrolase [Paracoccus sp. S-4012]
MVDLQLWGGCEYTVNRVGDRFFDQTLRTGHEDRTGDLELFAELGLRALRYPVLWERVSPERPDAVDFAWSDTRMAEIRRLGLRPIVGLVHHGSGPAYTSLVADDFAAGLAAHARAVAERYPWVEDWTPVNEPLTTARFSCLYGHWYPHMLDEDACWLALLNQIDATRGAMREIRRANPAARLIQTEDLGFCHAIPALAAEAAFENERVARPMICTISVRLAR